MAMHYDILCILTGCIMRILTVIVCSKRISLYIIESSTYSKDSQNIQALLFEDMQKFGSSCFRPVLTEKVPILHELDTLDT